MRVHLCLVEALGENLEECLVAGKPDVELALGTIESKSATLTTGENDHTDLTILYQLSTECAQGSLVH